MTDAVIDNGSSALWSSSGMGAVAPVGVMTGLPALSLPLLVPVASKYAGVLNADPRRRGEADGGVDDMGA